MGFIGRKDTELNNSSRFTHKNEDKKMETEINQHFHDAVNSDFEWDSCNGGG